MNRPLYSTISTLYDATNNEVVQLQPGVIRPPIRNAYNTQEEYNQAVQNGINYARKENIEYIDHY